MLQDLRQALRALATSPSFTSTAVLTLAVGVGGVSAAFSVLNWLFLRPLPGILDGDRLEVVQFEDTVLAGSRRSVRVTPTQFAELDRDLTTVAGLAAFSGADLTIGAADTAFTAHLEFVTPKYFAILGTRPLTGRLMAEEDDLPGSPIPIAVIGHELWITLFHKDPAVVGRHLKVNTETFTVVGVTPPGFGGADGPSSAALWIPSGTLPSVYRAFGEVVHYQPRITYWQFITRVGASHTFPQAESELDARGRHVLGKSLWAVRGVGVFSLYRGPIVAALRLVLGITTAVLLLACANLAGLILLKGLRQSGDIALRKVLGAGASDLARRQLLEAVLLAAGGTLLGLGLALVALRAFRGATLVRGAPGFEGITLDHRVALFAVGVSVVAAVLASSASVPLAMRIAATDVVHAGTRVTLRGRRFRRALTTLQLSVSLALMVGCLLLVRTLRNLARVDLGFDPQGVGMMEVQPVSVGHEGWTLHAYYLGLMDQLRRLPGIQAVSLASRTPFTGNSPFTELKYAGRGGTEVSLWTALATVSPDYFRTMRIPLLRGRNFSEAEFAVPAEERPPVAIVNQALAQALFGSADPLGQLLTMRGNPHPMEVVGVAADARWNTLTPPQAAWEGGPQIYQLFHASTSVGGQVIIRAGRMPLGQALSLARQAVAAFDRSVPVSVPRTLEENLADYLGPRRLLLKALGWLSALALAIAGGGLYGVVAYGVACQSRDLGIRLALGAPARRIQLLILRESCTLAALGAVIGTPLAVALGRAIASHLYGVNPADPGSLAVAVGLMLATALAAGWAPARRAARTDPMTELRS